MNFSVLRDLGLSASKFGTSEGWECLNGFSGFSLSSSNFVQTLEI